MAQRRTSLVQELEGKDVSYISTRIDQVLNNVLDPNERDSVMAEYRRKSAGLVETCPKQRNFFMAMIIDNFFDRKAKAAAVPTPTKPATAVPDVPFVKVNISAPVVMSDYDVTDDQIGEYRVIKTLGKGTFGKVKLGEHIITKQLVAIKIIEKASIKTQKQKISVDREVRLMKLLHHPHIVNVYEVYETRKYIFIVMEHAGGGELFDYIVKNSKVSEVEGRKLFRQLLSAVDYIHKNSVIHRDLKPENLLLDADKNIKLIDFGFGNTYHKDRLLETYCGSPFYAAPEMIQGIRYIGPEVDVWSMGVILYAMLSGRLPFDAPTMNELYAKIARGRFAIPSHFSPEVANLISRMLHIDPKKRITVVELRQHAWVNIGHAQQPIVNHVPVRPLTVDHANPQTLAELVTYGFRQEDSAQILKTETNLHPIVSLYHLIDETRRRKIERSTDYRRSDSVATASTRGGSIDSGVSGNTMTMTDADMDMSPSKPRNIRILPRFGIRERKSDIAAHGSAAADAEVAHMSEKLKQMHVPSGIQFRTNFRTVSSPMTTRSRASQPNFK